MNSSCGLLKGACVIIKQWQRKLQRESHDELIEGGVMMGRIQILLWEAFRDFKWTNSVI